MNVNIKMETLEMVDGKEVTYGFVKFSDYKTPEKDVEIIFRSHEEFLEEIGKMDFDYDNGYGTQYVYGTVVFTDNSWMEREEYDGSEWWDMKRIPSKESLGLE